MGAGIVDERSAVVFEAEERRLEVWRFGGRFCPYARNDRGAFVDYRTTAERWSTIYDR